jgi:putative NADH-flavin reductase
MREALQASVSASAHIGTASSQSMREALQASVSASSHIGTASSQSMREALQQASTSASSHIGTASTSSLYTADRLLAFDTERFPLRELVQEAIGVDELEKLHLHEAEKFLPSHSVGRTSAQSPQRRMELLRHALNEKWKCSAERKQWERELLPRIVRECIRPCSMPAEQQLIYQRSPLLRFHVAWPVEAGEQVDVNPANPPGRLALLHKDADTGHPSSEVNYLLPVTLRTHGANSLWVESEPNVGDYAPFELRYGQMMQWRGNALRHYSHRNTCDETRVSFDFRVIPGSRWEPPRGKSLFRLGSYYLDAMARNG